MASIYANLFNKRKLYIRKEFNSYRTGLKQPTWRPFHCFGTPIWPPCHHVKTLYFRISCTYRMSAHTKRGFHFRLKKYSKVKLKINWSIAYAKLHASGFGIWASDCPPVSEMFLGRLSWYSWFNFKISWQLIPFRILCLKRSS